MLSISQLCCLHEAVKERMPLPKRTLIKTVERAFSLENWSPKNNNGFTFYDETSDEFKGISLVGYDLLLKNNLKFLFYIILINT